MTAIDSRLQMNATPHIQESFIQGHTLGIFLWFQEKLQSQTISLEQPSNMVPYLLRESLIHTSSFL